MVTYSEKAQINKEDLDDLYSSVGWIAYTNDLDRLKEAIDHSLSVVTAWDNNQLVGLIRGVGDGYTILYIQDILVRPDFQNQNIGTQLMTRLLSQYQDVRQKVLLTKDAPDVRYFYEKLGFTSCDKGSIVAFYKEF